MTPAADLYDIRRERVFLLLAGFFIAAMTMLNILGITRFVQLGPLTIAVGVLPYPLTFLCTDLIGELYGRKRASFVVWCGFVVNLVVIGFVWLGQAMPAAPAAAQPGWQEIELASEITLATGETVSERTELFRILYACTAGSVFASMLAYLAAQFCDVYLFHFWKRLTKGKHLWLRNNGSTLASQLVDSIVVISVVFGRQFVGGEMALSVFIGLMLSNYAFKAGAALADTIPLYIIVRWLGPYLRIDPTAMHDHDAW